ncbi:serine hydrolase domain-containing protein [Xylanimonas sp. McL0601]|uniref:serine hydrolase domain-containing protein n=1 Tax=Xylanimonas sp. McL0601 TaxID=3414739 RepID=UPI003CF1E400
MTSFSRRLPRTSPEAAGVDPQAIAKLVDTLDALGGTHSLMVLRHGAVVAEEWWFPYAPEQRHMMFSVSKTFTSMAVGLAIAEGLLTVEDRVVDLLPDAVPAEPSEHLRAMRVRHLLTMTSGHASDSMGATDRNLSRPEDDWAGAILAVPVELEPGSRFVYDTGATYLLSAILHRLTGQRLLDYLTPRLLAPLGIEDATWEQDPRGIDVGGFGLSITTEDMAAFGQLLLQRGRWGEAQLVPAEWVDAAMAWQVDSAPQEWDADTRVGYGYQMWQCRSGAVRADGAFGQFVVVWPEHDVVVAMTSGSSATQAELDAVWDCLGGAFGPGAVPATTEVAPRELQLPVPAGSAWTALADQVDGVTFLLEEDRADAPRRTVTIRRDGALVVLDAGPLQARAAYGTWAERPEPDSDGLGVAATYGWTDEQTLEVRVAGLGTPFVWTARLAYAADGRGVELSVDQNVSFDATALLRATARAA